MDSLAVLCLWGSVMVLTAPGSAAPLPAPDLYTRGLDWLSRYGYLPPPDSRTGRLQTKEGITNAIRQMQRFAGLKETGNLDADTLKLMSMPRCSLPDIIGPEDMLRKRRKKRYALSGLQWEKTHLEWSVLNFPQLHQTIPPDTVKLIMYYAFKVWSDNTNLNFKEASPDKANQASIRISFHRSIHDDGYPFDGKGGTLAHAFFPGDAEISGDTHFDDDETWTYRASDEAGTDLFTVAVHEFGHALGLSHSSADISIMRPYYQGSVGEINQYSLPMDDLLAIQALYGVKGNRATPPNSGPDLPDLPNSPIPRGTVQTNPDYPDRCEGGFDAIANIRGDVFFFKGPYFWRMQRSGSLVSLTPARIENFWMGLPPGVNKIDTVYERKTDSHIIFFIGSQFWVFKDTKALPGYPRPLTDWGMRTHDGQSVDRVEAAFVWAHNGQTYLVSGGQFWRFTESQEGAMPRLDANYPKSISLWKGVPSSPDDIMAWGKAGDTYVFKDNSYWVLKSGGMDQDVANPKSIAVDWMFCTAPPSATQNPRPRVDKCSCGISGAPKLIGHSLLLILILQCISQLSW